MSRDSRNELPHGTEPCPKGLISKLASDLAQRSGRRIVVQVAVVALVAIAGAFAYFSVQQHLYGVRTLACGEVTRLRSDYQNASLTPVLQRSVQAHLLRCRPCRARYFEGSCGWSKAGDDNQPCDQQRRARRDSKERSQFTMRLTKVQRVERTFTP